MINSITLIISKTTLAEWVIRMRIPEGDGPFPVILLLHGWTGDENAMWIFASRLPKDTILISPRGLHYTPLGGYGWHPFIGNGLPNIDEFTQTIDALNELFDQRVDVFAGSLKGPIGKFNIIGFSQGAALAYSYALLNPEKVERIAGLSGFLPDGAAQYPIDRPLQDVSIFIAHGTQDDIIPIARAREAVKALSNTGASVSFCEDDVGHKLSSACFRGLAQFFSRN